MSISLLLIISVVLYITDLPSCFSFDQHYEACRLPPRCGSEPSLFQNITYPFWGNTIGRPNFCGQTGFELSCKKNQTLTLEIEQITFRVISVNLVNKSITVADESLFEDGCLNIFNFTGAKQFTLNHNTELVDIFNCADNISAKSLSTVSCQLSKENPITYHVFGSSHPPRNCTKVGEIPMLESAKNELRKANGSDQALKVALEKGFELRYDKEDKSCKECFNSTGICGSESRSGNFVCLCADKPHKFSCHDEKGPNYEVKIGIGAVASVVGISAASLFWFTYHRRITKSYRTSSDLLLRNLSNQFPKSSDIEKAEEELVGVRLFTYEELEEATNHFDPSKELGDGGFGTVYYGKLKDGRSVAVKRLYDNNFKRAEQFRNEVEILTGLRHPNLVTLFGCSSKQSRELLLVYEYVANGTLADHLHGAQANPSLLPWSTRLKIAVETASALNYLHASDIIHRDVKSTNILLDQNFNVKVADFGLSRLFPTGQTHVSTGPQGTPGYVDPDYHLSYQLSNKSDVYSFAVVLMELISSLPAVDTKRQRQEINLSNMAILKIQSRKLQEMVDPSLGFDTNTEVRQTVIAVAELAFQCLQSDKDLRPCMSHVMETLTRIQNIRFGLEKNVADVSKSEPLVAQSVDVADVSKSGPLVAESEDVANVSKSRPLVAQSVDVVDVSKSGPLVAQSVDVVDVSKSGPLVALSVDVTHVSKSGPLVGLSVDVADASKSGPSVAQSPNSVMVKWIKMVDPSLGFDTNAEVRQTVIAVAELALQCLQSDKDLRPCMSHVMETLKRIQTISFGSEKDVADVNKSGPLVAVAAVSKSGPSVAQSPDSVVVKWISWLLALDLVQATAALLSRELEKSPAGMNHMEPGLAEEKHKKQEDSE
ncbi:unnamed protein product [Eruca vesicaria subsp. sativa]|uniref:non-specific serine/threonine protein kinase n=1 Tax=Eruca vesicaria subsp. sativa TaxID=29727 RepID=A0ABC8M5P6_ERUVS|nr:unnamed protein product [Eruca vesicaria subsp. sativa]